MAVYLFLNNLKIEGSIFIAALISLFFGSNAYFGTKGDIIVLLISTFLIIIVQVIQYVQKNKLKKFINRNSRIIYSIFL